MKYRIGKYWGFAKFELPKVYRKQAYGSYLNTGFMFYPPGESVTHQHKGTIIFQVLGFGFQLSIYTGGDPFETED